MTNTNPLRFCLAGESAEIVDRILGPFMLECLGKNDMSIVTGLMSSAAILIVTHCQTTGDSIEEIANAHREIFDLALSVASEKIK
jgi:hypothetical protein